MYKLSAAQIMSRLEALDRHEVPLQEIYERDRNIVLSVPVHVRILDLSPELRTDPRLLSGAVEAVSPWFNEDMEYHIECLRKGGYTLRYLSGYEAFNTNWSLTGTDNGSGFLELHWDDNGTDRRMSFLELPLTRFYNQFGEDGHFYVPANTLDGENVEIMQRSVSSPDVIFMTPERMAEFATIDQTKTNAERGVVEAVGPAFCPDDYIPGMSAAAQGFLLRNFTVFYLNRLLDSSKTKLH